MSYVYLAFAIGFEVIATTSMKLSDGFTKLVPSVLMVVCYILSFGAMTIVLKYLDVSFVYAVWSGVGTALIAILGALVFHESLTVTKGFAILLIISGVVLLELGAAH